MCSTDRGSSVRWCLAFVDVRAGGGGVRTGPGGQGVHREVYRGIGEGASTAVAAAVKQTISHPDHDCCSSCHTASHLQLPSLFLFLAAALLLTLLPAVFRASCLCHTSLGRWC